MTSSESVAGPSSTWFRRLGFGLVAALYLLAFPYHPALRSPNELCRLWQSRSLVDSGKVSINEVMQQMGPVGDLSVKDGLYYPSKAPLLSFLAAPIYWVLKKFSAEGHVLEVPQVYFSRLFLTVLPALAMLWFLRKFLLAYVAEPIADAVTATYALGTMSFNYSQMFLSHQTTAVLLFSSFYCAWRVLRGDWKARGWLLSGAFAGATVATEYTGALGVLCVALFVVVSSLQSDAPLKARLLALLRPAGLVVAGALPFLVFLMAYHQACFGHPLVSGYKYLNDAGYQPWHMGGFLGIKFPDPRAFVLSFFSPLRGLFTLSPFLLIGFFGFRELKKVAPAQVWLVSAVWLSTAYFTSSFAYDSWGWAVGPRHMTPILPLLVLPVALVLARLFPPSRETPVALDAQVGAGMAAGLCAAAVLVTGTLTFVNYVPDSASTSLFGLAWQLFKAGYLPPTVLQALGWPNPTSGFLMLLLVLASAAWCAIRLLAQHAGWKPYALAAVVMALTHVGLLAAVTRFDEGDNGAANHLKSVWSAPPGQTMTFRR